MSAAHSIPPGSTGEAFRPRTSGCSLWIGFPARTGAVGGPFGRSPGRAAVTGGSVSKAATRDDARKDAQSLDAEPLLLVAQRLLRLHAGPSPGRRFARPVSPSCDRRTAVFADSSVVHRGRRDHAMKRTPSVICTRGAVVEPRYDSWLGVC